MEKGQMHIWGWWNLQEYKLGDVQNVDIFQIPDLS